MHVDDNHLLAHSQEEKSNIESVNRIPSIFLQKPYGNMSIYNKQRELEQANKRKKEGKYE